LGLDGGRLGSKHSNGVTVGWGKKTESSRVAEVEAYLQIEHRSSTFVQLAHPRNARAGDCDHIYRIEGKPSQSH